MSLNLFEFHSHSLKEASVIITEPTNKIAPRKDSTINFEGWEVSFVPRNDVAYLKCQVAAFPVPVYR